MSEERILNREQLANIESRVGQSILLLYLFFETGLLYYLIRYTMYSCTSVAVNKHLQSVENRNPVSSYSIKPAFEKGFDRKCALPSKYITH